MIRAGASDYRQMVAELRRQGSFVDRARVREFMGEVVDAQHEQHVSKGRQALAHERRTGGMRRTEFDVEDTTRTAVSVQKGRELLKKVHKTKARNELQLEFQEAADACYISHFVLKAAGKGGLRQDSPAFRHLQQLGFELRKALGAGSSGAGLEFVPTGFSRSLHEEVRLQHKVAALHPRIVMPTNPYVLPLEGADVSVSLIAEQTSDNTTTEANKITAATPGTNKITFTAIKQALRLVWSEEVDQDSIVPIQDFARLKLARALADGEEGAILNGDTTATHMDSDVTLATDYRKSWKGYRKLALAAAKFDAGNVDPTLALLRQTRRSMKKYAVDPTLLAWVVGMVGFQKLLNLPEVLTADKYGAYATVMAGELAKVDGIPIIVSELVRENLNASGVFDNVTTNRTIMHLVRTPEWLLGDRLQIQIKSAEMMETDQIIMITKRRLDFEPGQNVATEPIVSSLYDISTT